MILLDTHVVIWLAESPELLSSAAVDVIKEERKTGVLAVSDMTLLELGRILTGGKLEVKTSLSAFLVEIERNFKILPVTAAIAELTVRFSKAYPKDPIDRVIGATALAHSCRLITKDGPIQRSGEVDCVW